MGISKLRKLSLFLLLALMASCMTEKKWAEGCAERFLVKETTTLVKGEVIYDTTYLQPDTLVFTDTVTVDCDTATGVVTKYIYKEKACPPAQIRTVNRVDTVFRTVENLAAVVAAEIKADEEKQRADRITTGRDTWRWIAIVCILIIIGAVFSKIKGFI